MQAERIHMKINDHETWLSAKDEPFHRAQWHQNYLPNKRSALIDYI